MARTISVNFGSMPTVNGAPGLTFVRLSGREALGELFTYTVDLKTPDALNEASGPAANLDLKSVLGKECTVCITLDGKGENDAAEGKGEREINGLITNARIKKAEGRHIVYELTLRPWLWLATRTTDYKIFQEKSVVEILDEVLGDYSFSVEKRLNGDFPKRDYQVQYGETDFHFMQRLMQEWGIYWYFEHADGKHKLILCDHTGAHAAFTSTAYETLLFQPTESRLTEEYLNRFEAAEGITSGAWRTSDYDFTKPTADLTGKSQQPRDTAHSKAEIYEWPGDYEKPDEGEGFARMRMEALRAPGSRAHGEGSLRGIVPGCTFTLAAHPHDAANQKYLVLDTTFEMEDVAEESGHQQYRQHVRFTAQPAAEPFRPARAVPKPRTRGPQTATVTGPSGQEIWTDKYGRVKVQFHWDCYGEKDEKSSCWVRVSFPWAGSHFGAVYIPRIGQEVVVDFLNGDPDLPLITGRVYNANNMPPWPLPDNATQSGVLTRSSKEGSEDNANALRFEDKIGEEQIWLHAEKDQLIEVENDETHLVGHDRAKQVDNDETVLIKHDRTEEVENDESITIGNDQTILIKNDQGLTVNNDQSITVMNDRSKKVLNCETTLVALNQMNTVGVSREDSIGAAYLQSVGGGSTETVGMDKSVMVGKSLDLVVASNITTKCKERKDDIGKNLTQEIGEALGIKAGKTCTLDVGEQLEITCGKSSISMDKKGNITIKGEKFLFQSASDQTFKADGEIIIKGSKVKEN